jgi:integrase
MTEPKKDAKKPTARRRGRVYLRGGTWWLDFSRNGRRFRIPVESAKTENDAWDALDARREEVRQGSRPDIERTRFEQLIERLMAHYEAQGSRTRTFARIHQAADHLGAFFGSAMAREIADNVDGYVVSRRREEAAPATIKMELWVLGRAFKVARLPRPDLPAIEVRNVRTGFFEEGDLLNVVDHLPEYLRAVVLFGYHTGWRKGECLGLRWKDVDLAAGTVRLEPGCTKNGQGRVFPFSAHPELAELLKAQREATSAWERENGHIVANVFHRQGEPIKDMDDAWRAACRAAGVPGRLFHDLRRTAVRNLERARVPRSVAMKLTGHLTESVFKRYAIVDEADLSEGVAKLARSRFGTTSAQSAVGGTLKHSE